MLLLLALQGNSGKHKTQHMFTGSFFHLESHAKFCWHKSEIASVSCTDCLFCLTVCCEIVLDCLAMLLAQGGPGRSSG